MRLGARFFATVALGLLVLGTVPATAQSLRGGGAAPGAAAEATGLPVPAFARPLLNRLVQAQRELNATLSREMRAVRQGSPGAALAVAGIAFLYGLLHAAGPGHGKLVVSSFFLTRDARLATGVLAGLLFSLLQAASSIGLVVVLALMLDWGGFQVIGQSVWLELVCYALIVAIGLYLVADAIRGGHAHGAAAGPRSAGARRASLWGVVTAAGLTPCASAIIILLFAWANHAFALGIGATIVMALGMAITVSAMGLVTIGARRTLLRSARARPRALAWVGRALSLLGALLITVFGGLLCLGAWARLP